jgi:Anti-sigma-K factor rskA
MSCEQFSEDYELYALGLLETPEKDEFTAHLASGCENCAAQVNEAIALNALISVNAPQVEAPAALRRRMVETFSPARADKVTPFPAKRRAPLGWMFAFAAAAILMIIFGVGVFFEHQARLFEEARAQSEEARAQTNSAELARLTSALQVLQAPGVKRVTFGPQPETPHGSLFVHGQLGIVLIAGGLPAQPSGFRYESWIVPKTGAPKPIEPFQANANGGAVSLIPGPLDVTSIKAIAVSVEPDNVPAVTPTKVIFAAPVGE